MTNIFTHTDEEITALKKISDLNKKRKRTRHTS
jgi:hypothetical protein